MLKTHPNGMRFSCFAENGDLLATNEYFSVGGGFVVNEKTKGASMFFAFVPITVLTSLYLQSTRICSTKALTRRLFTALGFIKVILYRNRSPNCRLLKIRKNHPRILPPSTVNNLHTHSTPGAAC